MKCIILLIAALTFLASYAKAAFSQESLQRTTFEGSSFSDAIISILTVDACKYGAQLTNEAPPSGIRCRMAEMDLVAEFMVTESTIPKVVSCVHLNPQQRLQIREAAQRLVKEVLNTGKKTEFDIVVGTRTSVKLNLMGIPYFAEYPRRYDFLPSAKDVNSRSETIDTIAQDLEKHRVFIAAMDRQEDDLSRIPDAPGLANRHPYCSSISRLHRRVSTVRTEYLEKALKDENLPAYKPLSRDRVVSKGRTRSHFLPHRRSGCCVVPADDDDMGTRSPPRRGFFKAIQRSLSFGRPKKSAEHSDGERRTQSTSGHSRRSKSGGNRKKDYSQQFNSLPKSM